MTAPPLASTTPTQRRAVLGRLPRMHRTDGSPIRVLLVDDERVLTNLVSRALQYEGWVIEVAHDGQEALQMFRQMSPDVVVLDVMLPDTDGFQILQKFRQSGTYTPVLFLTARDSVHDTVSGLIAGGDDYMTKPFSLEVLVVRLRTLLRRLNETTHPDNEVLRVGDLVLDAGRRHVMRAGAVISLTATEFDLLRFLMGRPGQALSRREIIQAVWHNDFRGRSSNVDLYVSYLRKKIDYRRSPMLHTVRGVGYTIEGAR